MSQQYGQHYGSANHYGGYGSNTPPAMSTLLDKVPLGSDEENSKLLDLIDKLRECRVDQFIDLPQVVVVGDQSSGKSSVLEAITQIPFPRASIACTRFATQIRLRRDNSLQNTITKVSIIANKPKDNARYESFAHTVDDGSDFTDIFTRATELIFADRSPNFLSRDILSIERTGPNLPHVTLVDLPGIIHNATKTQSVADVEAISELSRFYMKKERTIILPIVGCDAEYARQIIVRRCKEADPAGIRTLGVITKPDMTLTAEREAEFIDLAANKDERNKLQLGWHVLKNRAHNEMQLTTEQRDTEERRYFANSKWGARLDPSQLGIEALRKKLSTQLIRHIATEVFKVQGDIERQLEACKAKLTALGPGLDTIDQMRQELQNLCKRSGSLTREAVQGHGINPLGEDFFPRFNDRTKKFARNLRSRVVILNENFSDGMENHGCAYLLDGQVHLSERSQRSGAQTAVPPSISRKEFIEREVKPIIRDNPGQELSVDINPRLVYRLFQSYSSNWPVFGDQHISSVQKLCEEFLSEVMAYAWPQRVRSRVWRGFVQQAMEERYREALKELNELKKDRFRNIRTYHSAFDQKYYSLRQQTGVDGGQGQTAVMNKYEDTLNKMLLYYEHQLPTFISNVITQVVERHLIDGMEEIFEGDRVHKLRDAQVKQLMEEDYGTQAERKEIRDQHDILQNGLEICREIARRPDLGPYEYQEPNLYSHQATDYPTRLSAVNSPARAVSPVPPRREVPPVPQVSANYADDETDHQQQYYNQRDSQGSSTGYGQYHAADPFGDNGMPGSYDVGQAQQPNNMKTPTSAQEEDDDLRKALEESAKEAARAALPPRPASRPYTGDDAGSIGGSSIGRRETQGSRAARRLFGRG